MFRNRLYSVLDCPHAIVNVFVSMLGKHCSIFNSICAYGNCYDYLLQTDSELGLVVMS